jgi:hypothetical protein
MFGPTVGSVMGRGAALQGLVTGGRADSYAGDPLAPWAERHTAEPVHTYGQGRGQCRAQCGVGLVAGSLLSVLMLALSAHPAHAHLVGEDHRLDPVAKIQLHQDPLDVGSDRGFLDDQRGGDLAVR